MKHNNILPSCEAGTKRKVDSLHSPLAHSRMTNSTTSPVGFGHSSPVILERSEENPVRSTPQSGSILVEAIVMIGLISALTPVLYKHVSDRRSEVEDINKANTFLLIQRETERYLKENRGNVASGLLPLSNIGLARLDSKYVIGIKRKEDGDVYAMIAEKESSNGGNDMKAGKVASLIGVSAGIYSAINSANAYGINGVWIEPVSDYSLNGELPTGSVVVTTQYNQEKQKFYSSDIDWSDGDSVTVVANTGFFQQVCIGNMENCVSDWGDVEGTSGIAIGISLCINDMNNGITPSLFCQEVIDYIQSCSTVSEFYLQKGGKAASGYYWLGSDAASLTKKPCFFVEGKMPTSEQIVEACNTVMEGENFACLYDYDNQWYMKDCTSIFNGDNTLETGYYVFSYAGESGMSLSAKSNPCVFALGKTPNAVDEVIAQCNQDKPAACHLGYDKNYNRNCQQILNSLGNVSGFYNLMTGTSTKQNDSPIPCYFVSGAVADKTQTLTNCNIKGINGNNANDVICSYGWYNNHNRSCEQIRSTSDGLAFVGQNNVIMTAKKAQQALTEKCYVSACSNNTDCAVNYNYGQEGDPEKNYKFCVAGVCSEGECATTDDCGDKGYCLNNMCSACTTDAQCGGTKYCYNGVCKNSCSSSSDCSGAACLPTTNASVKKCATGCTDFAYSNFNTTTTGTVTCSGTYSVHIGGRKGWTSINASSCCGGWYGWDVNGTVSLTSGTILSFKSYSGGWGYGVGNCVEAGSKLLACSAGGSGGCCWNAGGGGYIGGYGPRQNGAGYISGTTTSYGGRGGGGDAGGTAYSGAYYIGGLTGGSATQTSSSSPTLTITLTKLQYTN